jgi:hypothetical protein
MRQMTQNRAELILAGRALCQLSGAAAGDINRISHITFTADQCRYLLATIYDAAYAKAAQKYTALFDEFGTPTDTEAEKLLEEASVMVHVVH